MNAGAGSARVASVDASARVANRRIVFECLNFRIGVLPVEYVHQALASYDTPAVGSQACGEHAAYALPDAGTGRAGFSLSGRVLSLSLSISSDMTVASISIYDKQQGKDTGRTRSH